MVVSLSCGMGMEETVKAVLLVVTMIVVVVHIGWLHLNDQVSTACVHVLRIEDTAVGLKSTASLVPATTVESIEIVAPVELKFVEKLVVGEDFDVVVEDVPWHVNRVESCTPRVEGRSPEVHSEGLSLVHEVDSLDVRGRQVAYLSTVNRERHVIRGPLELICVPVIVWVKVVSVIVLFKFVVAVSVDHVCGHRVRLN